MQHALLYNIASSRCKRKQLALQQMCFRKRRWSVRFERDLYLALVQFLKTENWANFRWVYCVLCTIRGKKKEGFRIFRSFTHVVVLHKHALIIGKFEVNFCQSIRQSRKCMFVCGNQCESGRKILIIDNYVSKKISNINQSMK